MTEIIFFGWKIMEPVTALTDFITATVCFISFYRLNQLIKNLSIKAPIILYFLFTGFATFFAGLFSHALIHIVPFEFKMIGWTFSAIGIMVLEYSLASFISIAGLKKLGKSIKVISIIQFVIFIAIILYGPGRRFETVQINAAFGLIGIVFPIIIYIHRKLELKGTIFLLYALTWSIITGLVFNMEIGFHKYFNHHDLSHVMMSLFIILMYNGIHKLIEAKPGKDSI